MLSGIQKNKFNVEEPIKFIPETADYTENQKYLTNELNEILNRKANFIEVEEV